MIRGFLVFLIVSSLLLVSLFYFNDVFAACNPGSAPARADFLVTAPTLLGKFYSAYQSTGVCIFSPDISFDTNNVPNYDRLKTDYYTNSKPGTSKPPDISGPSLTIQNYYLYHSSGDLSLSSVTGSGIGLVFVDGNLEITGNILYGKGNAQSGLVFIVKGNVYINASVTEVNAVIVSEGKIYTAASLNGSCDTNFPHQALTVNGSLISINPTSPIVFCRDKLDNTTPAEIVNHQAKYLILLKNIFSETQQKWEEIVELPTLNVLPFYPTPIITLKANGSAAPITINNGTSVTLSWTTTNSPTLCNGSGSWTGSKPIPDGSEPTGSLSGPNTYTYTLTCSNLGGQNSASVTVTVNPPPPTVTLSANGSTGTITIDNNQTAQLSWVTTSSPTSCTASGAWSGAKSTTGGSESTGALSGPSSYGYTLTCSNAAGSASSSVTVNVNAPPPPPSCTGTLTFTLSPTTISPGGTLTPSSTGSNLSNCNGFSLIIGESNNCAMGVLSSCTISSSSGCIAPSFSAPSSSGSHTYIACISGSSVSSNLQTITVTPACTDGYKDNDKDGYGAGAFGCYTASASYNIVSNNLDCYDLNATARPDQTSYFPSNRGDGSYDYNCNNGVEYEPPYQKHTFSSCIQIFQTAYCGYSSATACQFGDWCFYNNSSCTGVQSTTVGCR